MTPPGAAREAAREPRWPTRGIPLACRVVVSRSTSYPRWSLKAWVAQGSIAMAVLGVAALGLTVFLADRALTRASHVFSRGEGESLVALVRKLLSRRSTVDQAAVDAALRDAEPRGLRYLSLEGPPGRRFEAGAPVVTPRRATGLDFGRGRVRLAATLAQPGDDLPPLAPFAPEAAFFALPSDPSSLEDLPFPPPMLLDWEELPPLDELPFPAALTRLTIEYETPLYDALRVDVQRTSILGGVAGTILVALAIAWWRSARANERIEEIAERDRRLLALGQMSSVMAHELLNPLASLKGHAQLLAEILQERDVADLRPFAQKADLVVAEAQRIEDLTRSLLEFVREGPIDRRPTSVAMLIASVSATLPVGKEVEIEHDQAPETLDVDAQRLVRALCNLLDNALRHGGAKDVRLLIRGTAEHVDFEVTDRGEGVGEADTERIFEPFVTTSVRGTGLGLTIARRVAEQHGGRLVHEPFSGGGSLFRIRLPRHP